MTELPVEHGAMVKKGTWSWPARESLFEAKRKQFVADMQQAQSQATSLAMQVNKQKNAGSPEVGQLQGQLQEARIKFASSKEQIDIIDLQMKSMSIESPIDGVITTWEVKKNMQGRPVEIGQELLAIADLQSDWELEVDVPDDDIGPVLRAQSKLKREIKEGKKKVGTTLFGLLRDGDRSRASLPRLCETDWLVGRDGREQARQGDGRVQRRGPRDFLPNQELRPCRGAGANRLVATLDSLTSCPRRRHVFYETVLFRWPFLR